jgi:adenylate cyclase
MLAERDEALAAVRRQTVAVLFADIVGFTRMSEAMHPEAVVDMLRQLHDRMTAQIFACNGSIEKYAGDEIFAVFGIPEAGPGDAADALNCAVRMLDALAIWNCERAAAGEPPLAMGIGINYGPAVFGDIGSEQSLAFSVIGDTVNTASRLQGLTRTLQTALVVSDAVVTAVKTSGEAKAAAALLHLHDCGERELRGRTALVRIWTSDAAS